MNEESMEVMLEGEWLDGEDAGAEFQEPAADGEAGESAPMEVPAPESTRQRPEAKPAVPSVLKGEAGREHPLLTRVRENARKQDMERFLNTYPEVKGADIPRQVWEQVAGGVPLVSAYAMHENQMLKVQLAAERQDRLNRQRTPGGLSAGMGAELDEMDRMWSEDD